VWLLEACRTLQRLVGWLAVTVRRLEGCRRLQRLVVALGGVSTACRRLSNAAEACRRLSTLRGACCSSCGVATLVGASSGGSRKRRRGERDAFDGWRLSTLVGATSGGSRKRRRGEKGCDRRLVKAGFDAVVVLVGAKGLASRRGGSGSCYGY
jgi:hypothetical protein